MIVMIGLFGGGLIVMLLLTLSFLFIWKTRKKYAGEYAKIVKGTKNEVQNEKAKADIIIGSIEDGVIMIGADNLIQLINNGASKIIGWPLTEATNLDYHSVIKLVNSKGEPYNEDQDPFLKVLRDGQSFRDNKAVVVTKSNDQTPINISVSPLLNEQNKVEAVIGIFRDVTSERAEEQQRAEFISTASHEMRTPVAAIEGYLALALNEKVANIDKKARDYLEKAHLSTQHLGQLFQDLLTSAKAEDGRLVSHPQIVDIGALLVQITDNSRFSAEKKGLLLEFLIGANQPGEVNASSNVVIRPLYYAQVDPDRLREVITNLFDNAVKYSEKGKITVGLTGNNEVVQFFIRDTGAGIPPEDVPHLFQKFYRVDSTATRTIGGTGLGLFICRKIMELYNGRIWVESKLDEGSTFFINIPRISSQKAVELQKSEALTKSPLSS